MRFEFTAEETNFKSQLSAFLDDVLPDDWHGPADESLDDHWELNQSIKKGLAERGWLVMSWPKEYGGADSSPMMNTIFAEEMAYRRAPGHDRFGTRMFGPTLMRFGTEEQKKTHLGAIANGDIQWCQGYSEPNSGSDLASLQTKAIEDGDDFIVTGAKIWTSLAHRADMMFMLVRTDPEARPHKGISLILVDMKSPGVEVQPIVNMAGVHSFNQVVFDQVRVPKTNLVGDLNDGWRAGMTVLNFERSGIDYAAWARVALEELVDYVNSDTAEVSAAKSDPSVRVKLAELHMEAEAARLMCYDVSYRQGKGEIPSSEASMSKVAASEVYLKVLDYGVDLLGMYGVLEPGSDQAELQGRFFKMRMFYTSGPILAGTNEIQKNIIAQRGLGLPRK
ncbi:acyl-CoA dehydrogenase family protein [Candidatus Lucifugimonas marina]|uniref:Acyl-CoA dehydrogenase n=1 Tax=Candidatus Lucifugimonas marina TaxID=3038979 RepID=A0AAJ5ZKX4_9CHLR|nr:acyl-CoA dehydrogenase [SAR202 cluster bacterium JH702]MDG0870655.1 acyl-CoA dehydrogenase [SAR202 cluster bacterium JH639]WFG36599.1 acyl-CoA dehydrogenase [SAR202 cluster bacterium JH545]WFG40532.1 acyl-CoA dehydrogenase [SAR202 cluster bacterium JH1073]